jgi:hypothetical protein
MAITVFANGQGFFHKGSGGTGKAFPDVCLSPPPPPTGPVPVPYPNNVSASDLSGGSKTVKIDGEPTALEDASYCSTSSGDEGGTQGGGVVSHKTKGTGCFTFWSLDVKVEGKGVDRHHDPMLQNCGSQTPPNGLTAQVGVTAFKAAINPSPPCCPPPKGGHTGGVYRRKKWIKKSSTDEQKKHVNKVTKRPKGPKCWECGSTSPRGYAPPPPKGVNIDNPPKGSGKKKIRFIADHDPPLIVRHYSGGCHNDKKTRKANAESLQGIVAHCSQCSGKQGAAMKAAEPAMRQANNC